MRLMNSRFSRNSNIELLRIISMLMIITLHYLYNGGVLDKLSFGDNNYIPAWILESFCYVSVNCYVLISGYYLSTATEIKIAKVIETVLEVVFYSVGIYLVFCAIGFERFSIKSLITGHMFPITHGSYWFASVYIVLYLLSPLLNRMISSLSQSQHKKLLIITGVIFSVLPSVVFFYVDQVKVASGYSLIWFLFLYFLSAYFRKYSITIKVYQLVILYISGSLLSFAVKVLQQLILKKELLNLYQYSSITVLCASVALFLLFIQMKPRTNPLLQIIGRCTFGVFLIHTHFIIVHKGVLWDMIVRPTKYCDGSTITFILHLVISVLAIFLICCIIDIVRQLIFYLAKQSFIKVRK